MTAGEMAILLAAVLCSLGFTALVVVLVRVLDALRELRRDVDDLRSQTGPLLVELKVASDEANSSIAEARADLERFDRVLGSAEAIGDAVGGRVAKASFSSPMIKAAGLAKGTSRTIARLRGQPVSRGVGPSTIEARAELHKVNEVNAVNERAVDRRRRA